MPNDASQLFGRSTPRIDGVAKVTGAARYASDEPVANPAFAYLVTSGIARGRIGGFNLEPAKAVAGVLDILTHENVAGLTQAPLSQAGGPTTTTLESDHIWHDGQIIAVVVADTYEGAREAANKVGVNYVPEPPGATFDSPGVETEPHQSLFGPDPQKGDAEVAFAAAPVKVEARYQTPTQHHNAIELFTATCVWDGPQLTIYEPSQMMWGTKAAIARQLGLDPANVRVVSRYVGGAFGAKGWLAATAWIAIAAKRLGRPVKLVATRDQSFTIASYRAETRQHVKLGAARDGKLISYFHEGWDITSRPSGLNLIGVDATARVYACPNIATAGNVVH
ncbi:MAG TPA: molybdopterin cofactor-binding domain-containing protein, partial [Stellaceae bacterium]